MSSSHRRTLACFVFAVVFLAASGASAQIVPIAHVLNVDVPSVEISGDFLVDGVPTPASAADVAILSLLDRRGEAISVGATNMQTYGPLRVVPGEYGVLYDFLFSSGSLPINTGTPISSDVAFDASGVFDIDVPTVEITFTLLLNGVAFPAAVGETGDFLLRHVDSGAEFLLGQGANSPIVARVVPGAYQVIYSYRSGSIVPQNTHAVVDEVTLRRDGNYTVDLTAHPLFLDPSLDGAPFPLSSAERGELRLVDFESGDEVAFGPTNAPTGSRVVIAGTYDVAYSRLQGGGFVPANSNAVVLEDVSIQPPANPSQLLVLSVPVTTFEVGRAITFDGSPPPLSQAERGDIVLVGPNGDEIDFGSTHEPPPTRRLIAGTYDVFYRGVIGWTVAPGNKNAKIASSVRIDEDETVAIDIETIQVSSDLLVDGQPFPPSQLERGRFTLVGAEPGDEIDLRSTNETTPSPRVVVGSYDVVYDWEAGSIMVPRNEGFHAVEDTLLAIDQTVVVDLTMKTVVPTFLLDGAPFPGDPAESGSLVLRDPNGGEVPLGTTDVAVPDTVLVVEAPYAVDYRWNAGVSVPRNPSETIQFTSVPEPGFGLGVAVGGFAFLVGLRRRGRVHRS
ncbi:MAG: hypothetical protein NXI30_01720 [bacterium]|nr:hypothetical protein [bacterium]